MRLVRGALVLTAAALTLALGACAKQATAADLQGAWWADSKVVVLHLSSGGRCSSEATPSPEGSIRGTCRWTLQDGGSQVLLDYSGDPDAGVQQVTYDVRGGGAHLGFYDASLDKDIELSR